MVATMRNNQVGMSENGWYKAAPLTTHGSHGSWEFEGKRCKNKYITGHTTQVLSSTNLTEKWQSRTQVDTTQRRFLPFLRWYYPRRRTLILRKGSLRMSPVLYMPMAGDEQGRTGPAGT